MLTIDNRDKGVMWSQHLIYKANTLNAGYLQKDKTKLISIFEGYCLQFSNIVNN